MNVLLYFLNEQPQAWHESLEMTFNIIIRFNIWFFLIQAHSKYQAFSGLYF